jgi:Ca2+-binding EF-hand superfamily protein
MARQLSRCFDADPSLKPPVNPNMASEVHHQIELSSTQAAQIREMFNLFDTDGGGSIDRKELDFAMDALGFQDKKSTSLRFPISKINRGGSATKELMETIMADGAMTLEEFSAVMMGEISGQSPMEDVYAVFSVLSKSDGDSEYDNLITLSKMHAVCRQFQVKSQLQPTIMRLS